MKLKKITIWLSILVVAAAATAGWVLMSKAAAQEDFIAYCKEQGIEFDAKNIYANYNLGTDEVITLYHETMNKQFNAYIKQMLAAESAGALSCKPGEPCEATANGKPPEIDPATNTPKACDEKNYSTYCVGERLLTDPAFGYIAYRKSLDCRSSAIFDNATKQDAWGKYINTSVCLGGLKSVTPPQKCTPEEEKKLEAEIGSIYQTQKVLEITAETEAITREKTAAKEALDQTLSAYNELRVAWPMHKQYVKIYADLLKYRDKLVEVRHQVESFPSKFIDATTTKCT